MRGEQFLLACDAHHRRVESEGVQSFLTRKTRPFSANLTPHICRLPTAGPGAVSGVVLIKPLVIAPWRWIFFLQLACGAQAARRRAGGRLQGQQANLIMKLAGAGCVRRICRVAPPPGSVEVQGM